MKTQTEPMPPQVRAAFQEVRRFYPEVTHVRYDADGRWLFTDSHGDAPEFAELVDVGTLEDAADSVQSVPAYFNWEEAE